MVQLTWIHVGLQTSFHRTFRFESFAYGEQESHKRGEKTLWPLCRKTERNNCETECKVVKKQ